MICKEILVLVRRQLLLRESRNLLLGIRNFIVFDHQDEQPAVFQR